MEACPPSVSDQINGRGTVGGTILGWVSLCESRTQELKEPEDPWLQICT